MRATATTPAEPADARVARFPAGGSLPRQKGGSASALLVSEPAQRSLALQPAWSQSRPRRPRYIGVLQAMSLPPSPAPIATGWSDSCRAGFAPARRRRLSTAHQPTSAKCPLSRKRTLTKCPLPDHPACPNSPHPNSRPPPEAYRFLNMVPLLACERPAACSLSFPIGPREGFSSPAGSRAPQHSIEAVCTEGDPTLCDGGALSPPRHLSTAPRLRAPTACARGCRRRPRSPPSRRGSGLRGSGGR